MTVPSQESPQNASIDSKLDKMIEVMAHLNKQIEKAILEKATLTRLALWLQKTERERNQIFEARMKLLKEKKKKRIDPHHIANALPENFGVVE